MSDHPPNTHTGSSYGPLYDQSSSLPGDLHDAAGHHPFSSIGRVIPYSSALPTQGPPSYPPSQVSLQSTTAVTCSSPSSSSTAAMPTRTKIKLTAIQKKELCGIHAQYPRKKQEDLAKQFGIERSTVSKILKDKDRWLGNPTEWVAERKKEKECGISPKVPRSFRFIEIEEHMSDWAHQIFKSGQTVSDGQIREKALGCAQVLSWPVGKFKASTGWIENFRDRHQLRKQPSFASTSSGRDLAGQRIQSYSPRSIEGSVSPAGSSPRTDAGICFVQRDEGGKSLRKRASSNSSLSLRGGLTALPTVVEGTPTSGAIHGIASFSLDDSPSADSPYGSYQSSPSTSPRYPPTSLFSTLEVAGISPPSQRPYRASPRSSFPLAGRPGMHHRTRSQPYILPSSQLSSTNGMPATPCPNRGSSEDPYIGLLPTGLGPQVGTPSLSQYSESMFHPSPAVLSDCGSLGPPLSHYSHSSTSSVSSLPHSISFDSALVASPTPWSSTMVHTDDLKSDHLGAQPWHSEYPSPNESRIQDGGGQGTLVGYHLNHLNIRRGSAGGSGELSSSSSSTGGPLAPSTLQPTIGLGFQIVDLSLQPPMKNLDPQSNYLPMENQSSYPPDSISAVFHAIAFTTPRQSDFGRRIIPTTVETIGQSVPMGRSAGSTSSFRNDKLLGGTTSASLGNWNHVDPKLLAG
ncbi:DNA-binding centromere protein B (CENP-B) [Phaffia rhodozyma]|uniref:DNA-binding centromere protein B (CENP-B) n=1 Tax=Phaffia rhodozyma TaxID=264483 RepID=A0A0F7SNY6_PHARH|nr:DNA-binding centromere protein B (CENP-B) [Phaffia rhodozyma]